MMGTFCFVMLNLLWQLRLQLNAMINKPHWHWQMPTITMLRLECYSNVSALSPRLEVLS